MSWSPVPDSPPTSSIDGESIITPTIHNTLAVAVSGADEHLAGTIAGGLEARRMGLSIAQIGS
ncbi:hypothetical protein CIK73_06060 [Brachybacterium alimentarium]|nr:hypothetical protein CIK73_06060 [Brachybacterium alimentarium]